MNISSDKTDAYGCSDKNTQTNDMCCKDERKHCQRSYERFFAGYEAKFVPRSNGRGNKLVREYKGTIYRQNLTPKRSKELRLLFAGLFIFAAALFLVAISIRIASNTCWYVAISEFLACIFYGRLLLCLHTYFWSSSDLTEYEYSYGARQLPIRSGQLVFVLVVIVIVTIVMFFLRDDSFSSMELFRFGLLGLSGLLVWLLGRFEARTEYWEISQDDN